jgi:Methylamine utilisation protein MauE
MAYAALTCRGLVGLVFAVSAFTKIRNVTAYREFASWLAGLPVPLAGTRGLAPVLAGAEAVIVVLVAVPATAVAGLALAALTLAFLTAGVAVAVSRGARASCQCFGPSRAPLAVRHIVRNGFLLLVAVTGALGAAAAGARPAGIALSLAAAVAAATFVVFLDDLADLVGRDQVTSAGPAPAGHAGWAGQP